MDKRPELFYFQATDLWQRLCDEHGALLKCTLDEYALLLGSELEKLEEELKKKDVIVRNIRRLDGLRRDLLDRINGGSTERRITDAKGLLAAMERYESTRSIRPLSKYHAQLKDIIAKIQDQNKKNRLFINKAALSLREIKEEVTGRRGYATYDAKGEQELRATAP